MSSIQVLKLVVEIENRNYEEAILQNGRFDSRHSISINVIVLEPPEYYSEKRANLEVPLNPRGDFICGYYLIVLEDFLAQNSFPMKQWHVEHMQKTVVKYVKGLSEDASGWEKRNHKKYGNLASMCRQIDYDIKHGVSLEEVLLILEKVRKDKSFTDLRKRTGSIERLNEVESYFMKPKIVQPQW